MSLRGMRAVLTLALAQLAAVACDQKASTPPSPAPVAEKKAGLATLPQLQAIKLPLPPRATAKGEWRSAFANEDGDRLEVWKEGDNRFGISIRFIDCRAKKVVEVKDQPELSQADYAGCHRPGKDRLGKYELRKPRDGERTLRAGSILIRVTAQTDETPAELEQYLGKLDLDAIARL